MNCSSTDVGQFYTRHKAAQPCAGSMSNLTRLRQRNLYYITCELKWYHFSRCPKGACNIVVLDICTLKDAQPIQTIAKSCDTYYVYCWPQLHSDTNWPNPISAAEVLPRILDLAEGWMMEPSLSALPALSERTKKTNMQGD
jgi:hypothetical protein